VHARTAGRRAEENVDMRIEGPGRPAAPSAKPAARRAGAAFALADPAGDPAAETQAAPEAAAPEAAAPVQLSTALPPPEPPGEPDDRAAARQGAALLDAMAGLQQALIGGDQETARACLATRAESPAGAADPRLDSVLKAVAQRAAVELARRQ
jgi:hypothetical protein